MGHCLDLGVAGADDCRVQHNGGRRRPKVGHRRQTRQEISRNSALVKDHPVMTSHAKKANDKLRQFALGRSRNPLTKSEPKTIRSIGGVNQQAVSTFHLAEEDSMTTLGRSKTICLLAFGMLIFTSNSCSQKRSAAPEKTATTNAEQIAKTYGLDSFGQIEAIRYTWNAQFPRVNLSHSWVW